VYVYTTRLRKAISNASSTVLTLAQVYLLNKPEDAVTEMLDGLIASVPHLQRLDGFPEARLAWSEHALLVLLLLPVTVGKAYRRDVKIGTGQGGCRQHCLP